MWITEWGAIRARISAIVNTASFFLKTNEHDNYGSADILIQNAGLTVKALRRFLEYHGSVLPSEPRKCLEAFLHDCSERFGGNKHDPLGTPTGFGGVTGVVTYLASFSAEFDYLISDATEVARGLTVRALVHLQRSIVADDLVAERWRSAYTRGEVACEKLGSCHFLAHGIWAFKTSATGERTDLILSERLEITDTVRRAAEGLILTEWKLVSSKQEVVAKARAALEQARRYREGILAGFEVASPRYLILVSEDRMPMPEPIIDGGVVHEYHNIAVSPQTPSRSAPTS